MAELPEERGAPGWPALPRSLAIARACAERDRATSAPAAAAAGPPALTRPPSSASVATSFAASDYDDDNPLASPPFMGRRGSSAAVPGLQLDTRAPPPGASVPRREPRMAGKRGRAASAVDVVLEVCVDSVASAVAAECAGAHRLELCSSLVEGGVTPSLGLMQAVVRAVTVPVMVLVRPRSGDFLYDAAELEVMCADIDACKEVGAAGVVLGCLQADGSVDMAAMRRLIDRAQPLEVTFHRAFDMSRDPEQGACARACAHAPARECVLRGGAQRSRASASCRASRGCSRPVGPRPAAPVSTVCARSSRCARVAPPPLPPRARSNLKRAQPRRKRWGAAWW